MARWRPVVSGQQHLPVPGPPPHDHGPGSFYDWNTTLAQRYLGLAETGLVAWTTALVNGRDQRVYLPLSVASASVTKGPYRLAVVPPVDLSEVFLTVVSTTPGAIPIQNEVPLRYGSYPKDQKIDVDLPALPAAGLYRVILKGNRRDQGSVQTPPFLISVP